MIKWATNHKKAPTIPQPDKAFYRHFWERLGPDNEKAVRDFVSEYIKEHMISSSSENRFETPLYVGHGKWAGTPLKALHEATKSDEEECERFFNLMFFEVFMKDKETWYAGRSARASFAGISYFRPVDERE